MWAADGGRSSGSCCSGILLGPEKRKPPRPFDLGGFLIKIKPGDDLLSHNRSLHYHRRHYISLLCSEWEQVGL